MWTLKCKGRDRSEIAGSKLVRTSIWDSIPKLDPIVWIVRLMFWLPSNLHLLTTRVNTSHRFSMITQAPSAKLQNTISGLKWTGGIRDSELVSHAMTCPDAGKRHSRIYAAGRPTHDRSISSDALPTYEMLEPSEHAYLHRTGLYAWPLRGSD